MCGIAGFYGPFGKSELTALTAAMTHRGPDDEGLEILPGFRPPDQIGLGHRRLSIIDLASGHQPMWSADGSIGIVFNGEIYNYRELRRKLQKKGARFKTSSDTEVIIEGWRLLGPRIFPELAGMFAFGLWDQRTRRWILARDRSGIKPLYYITPEPGYLVFASEIRPLLPILGRVAPNLGSVYDFLLYGWTPGPETVFTDVRHLPLGHWASWAPGEIEPTLTRYAQRHFSRTSLSPRHAAAELRERFDCAIESHLVADVPIGVNLSGGLDSSAVIASMAKLYGSEPVKAFTIGFGLTDDETPYAKRMVRHVGANHHVRLVPKERIAENFARIVRTVEEPIAHPVMQTTYDVAALAREHLKVVMIGEGSDELFLGYPQSRLLTPPFCWGPRKLLRNLYLGVTCLMPQPEQIFQMLMPHMRDRALFDASARRFNSYFTDGDMAESCQAFELDNPLVANQLMRIDKLTMAQGVEARVPFLDNQFVDFALSLPVGFKLRGNTTKAVLRDAMADRLPPEILSRPKTGRGGTQALLPYFGDMLTNGPLADLVSRDTIGRRGWFDPDTVLRYLARECAPGIRYHPIESRRRKKFVLALAILEQWAREFLDKSIH